MVKELSSGAFLKVQSENEKLKAFMNLVKPHVGEKVLLLGDVKSYGKHLRKRGVDVTILENVYDYEKSSIIKNCSCNIVDGSPEYMPFKNETFDKIVLLDNFHFVEDKIKVLQEVYRVLKFRGEVVLSEKDPRDIRVLFTLFFNKICGHECQFFKPEFLKTFFQSKGFYGETKALEKQRYVYIGRKIG